MHIEADMEDLVPNQIMVALDGSEKEQRALPVSLALANIADSGLHLVRVIAPLSDRLSNQAELIGLDPKRAPARRQAEEETAAVARSLTTQSGRAVSWEVLDGSDVPLVLSTVARERDVRVVVMGTRAASATGRAIRGSVADRVMRECPKPVVLVPPGASDLRGKQIEIKRLLVPLDGSALASRSVDFLLDTIHTFDLELVLLEVVQNPADAPFMERRLQSAADRFHGRSAEAVPRIVPGVDVPKAIVAAVREFTSDLIAMSTRGEGGLRRFVLGSVAEGVIRAAEVPVLLLTPAMLAAGADADPSRELAPQSNA